MTQSWSWKFIGLTIFTLFWADIAAAQLRPVADETLGNERSIVTPDQIRGLPGDRIDGGARRGANLFHSFEQFSIDKGRAAYFANPDGVENILSRVTGGRRSEIFGRLGVLGDANLFLINPQGMLFGRNASLDIRGSFIGTTADAIRLQDEGLFSAAEPAASSLLTINPTALVFLDQINRPIVNQSRFANPNSSFAQLAELTGLQVPPNQTIALVGGDLLLKGGGLTATGGRVELGSVNQAGEVRLRQERQGWVFGYNSLQEFGTVQLEEGAAVNAGILGGGSIQVQASRLLLLDGSRIYNQPLMGQRPGGNLTINATDSVELAGIDRRIEGRTIPGGLVTSTSSLMGGLPGDVLVTTRRLTARDGATISVVSFNPLLSAGSIRINAAESVVLDGAALVDGSPDRLFITNLATGGLGKTGSIRIDTRRLVIQNGAAMFAASAGFSGGGLIINASESVRLSGSSVPARIDDDSEPVRVPTGLYADTFIFMSEPADAIRNSDITINTARLRIEDGAVISVSFLSPEGGRGGNVQINASEWIEIAGASPNGIRSGVYAQSFAAGRSGDLNIATEQLSLSNGGQISVNSTGVAPGGVRLQLLKDLLRTVLPDIGLDMFVDEFAPPNLRGTGEAGNIQIQAGSVTLDAGSITASTPSRDGGSITLDDLDSLLLRRGGTISTEAGTEQQGGGGNGGDITINADFIVAPPPENSDINANAFDGSGGTVNITTEGLFGIEPRAVPTELSDITASSEQGVQGTVNLDIPDVDPRRGLTQIPVTVLDASSQISQACPVGGSTTVTSARDQFVVTGRGGLPPNPLAPFNGDGTLADWATLDEEQNNAATDPPDPPSEQPIAEATGWGTDESGNVVLIAQAPTAPTQPLLHCQ